MTKSRVAQRYARAIMEIAQSEKSLDAVIEDMRTLGSAIEGSTDLQNLLASPIYDERLKDRLLREIFNGKISAVTGRFISLMALKGRSNQLPKIIQAFQELLDQERNVMPATITTAVELGAEQRGRIEEQIARMSGHNVRATYKVDPSLIGGFQALFEDTMIDASIRHQLGRMYDSLVVGSAN
jgi:F-type H+-transporting ATPase subunit delta